MLKQMSVGAKAGIGIGIGALVLGLVWFKSKRMETIKVEEAVQHPDTGGVLIEYEPKNEGALVKVTDDVADAVSGAVTGALALITNAPPRPAEVKRAVVSVAMGASAYAVYAVMPAAFLGPILIGTAVYMWGWVSSMFTRK